MHTKCLYAIYNSCASSAAIPHCVIRPEVEEELEAAMAPNVSVLHTIASPHPRRYHILCSSAAILHPVSRPEVGEQLDANQATWC
jgi:hypothetical protein